jgi:hypothetical protein
MAAIAGPTNETKCKYTSLDLRAVAKPNQPGANGYTRIEQDLSEGATVHGSFHYLCYTHAGYVKNEHDIEDIQIAESTAAAVACPAGKYALLRCAFDTLRFAIYYTLLRVCHVI